MPSVATLAAFAATSFVMLVIPGPAVLYIVNHSVSDGRRVGLAAVAGVTLGNLTHAVAAAVGLWFLSPDAVVGLVGLGLCILVIAFYWTESSGR